MDNNPNEIRNDGEYAGKVPANPNVNINAAGAAPNPAATLDPKPKKKKLTWLWILIGVIVVAGGAVAAIVLTQKPAEEPEPEPEVKPVENMTWEEINDRNKEITACLEGKRLNGINYDDMTDEQRKAYWDCM